MVKKSREKYKLFLKKRLPFLLSGGAAVYFGLVDVIDTITGRTDDLTPPTRLMFDGPRSVTAYRENGRKYLEIFKELGGLRPDHKVLDVGSGIGRKTVPLTGYLDLQGSYDGFDIVPAGVAWCREHITARYPNFRFQLADVYNEYYNPTGTWKAAEYTFPYPDDHFDFVFLGSVFTHMVPGEMENYLSEIFRVLSPGGRCLVSYFLMNDESSRLIREQKSGLDFIHDMGGYFATNRDIPEAAIAYDEKYVRDLFRKYGEIIGPVHYGSWCGREEYLDFQDIVVAEKYL